MSDPVSIHTSRLPFRKRKFDHQQVLKMFVEEGLSRKEIACNLNTNNSTVSYILRGFGIRSGRAKRTTDWVQWAKENVKCPAS